MCLLANHIQSYTHFDNAVNANAKSYAFIQKPVLFLPNYSGAPSGLKSLGAPSGLCSRGGGTLVLFVVRGRAIS